MINCEPSRFIDELPQDDAVAGGGADTKGRNEERGQETLAGLKDCLLSCVSSNTLLFLDRRTAHTRTPSYLEPLEPWLIDRSECVWT
jgi:hypothetical protein